MFKKISLGLLRPRKDESASAKERARAASMPRPSSPLDFSDGDIQEDVFRRQTDHDLGLEALSLESITAPFLRQMRPLMAPREVLMGEMPRRPGQSKADRVRQELDRRPSEALEAMLQNADMGLLKYPVALSTPDDEWSNPFDDPELNAMIITHIPRRPELKRRPVSARGRRDMPLRVQAMRRNHQYAFAKAIQERIEEEAASWSRRTSAEEGQDTTDFRPSGLYERRRKSSPEREEEEMPMRLNLHAEDPQGLFRQRTPDGQSYLYQMDSSTPTHRIESPIETDPLDSGDSNSTTPTMYVGSDGRRFF